MTTLSSHLVKKSYYFLKRKLCKNVQVIEIIHVHKYTICNQYLIFKKRETDLLREIKLEFESSLI